MGRIAQLRQQELLAATINVIAEKGLSGITVNDVAKEAGCSFGVIAFHFKTKEKLLMATLNSLVEEYDEFCSRTATIKTGPEAAAELIARIDVDFNPRVTSRSKLAVWAAFWGEASRVPAYRSACGKLKRRYRQEMLKLVAMVAKYQGQEADAEMIAAGMNALVDGFWIYGHVTGDFGTEERARARTACIAFLSASFPKLLSIENAAIKIKETSAPKTDRQESLPPTTDRSKIRRRASAAR